MGTLIVKGHSAQAERFMEYARTLPFVKVVEENDRPERKFKPAVAKALRESEQGVGLTECRDVDDMFEKLGL